MLYLTTIVGTRHRRTGEIQNPAMGFVHEVGHWLIFLKLGRKAFREREAMKQPNNPFHNPEEEDVIKNVETPAAKKLKQPVRTNHDGNSVRVKGLTSSELDE